MRMRLMLFLGVAMTFTAQARDVDVTWTPPATFTDGSPLVPSQDLSGYRFFCGNNQVGTAGASSTSAVITIPSGPCDFSARSVSVDGAVSDMSNVVIVDGLTPSPPTITLVEAIVRLAESVDGLSAAITGTGTR